MSDTHACTHTPAHPLKPLHLRTPLRIFTYALAQSNKQKHIHENTCSTPVFCWVDSEPIGYCPRAPHGKVFTGKTVRKYLANVRVRARNGSMMKSRRKKTRKLTGKAQVWSKYLAENQKNVRMKRRMQSQPLASHVFHFM